MWRRTHSALTVGAGKRTNAMAHQLMRLGLAGSSDVVYSIMISLCPLCYQYQALREASRDIGRRGNRLMTPCLRLQGMRPGLRHYGYFHLGSWGYADTHQLELRTCYGRTDGVGVLANSTTVIRQPKSLIIAKISLDFRFTERLHYINTNAFFLAGGGIFSCQCFLTGARAEISLVQRRRQLQQILSLEGQVTLVYTIRGIATGQKA